MKVLIACECSGIVRQAFRKKGHNAWSADLKPAEDNSRFHFTGPVEHVLYNQWDLVIAHPPCTFLCVSGNAWLDHPSYPTRRKDRENAIKFFRLFVDCPCSKVAIENPVGIMSTEYREPDQYIEPYEFGHNYRKKTGLWLKGLPLLKGGLYVMERGSRADMYHKMPPSEERSANRSRTSLGIALAMADQWGGSVSTPL